MTLLVKALEVVKTGIGMPSFASDRSYIEYFLSAGVRWKRRRYHIVGCLDPAIPGKVSALAGMFLSFQVLEIFLHSGVDPRTGLEAGPLK